MKATATKAQRIQEQQAERLNDSLQAVALYHDDCFYGDDASGATEAVAVATGSTWQLQAELVAEQAEAEQVIGHYCSKGKHSRCSGIGCDCDCHAQAIKYSDSEIELLIAKSKLAEALTTETMPKRSEIHCQQIGTRLDKTKNGYTLVRIFESFQVAFERAKALATARNIAEKTAQCEQALATVQAEAQTEAEIQALVDSWDDDDSEAVTDSELNDIRTMFEN